MYLLKVRIQLYKNREWITFTARGMDLGEMTLTFWLLGGSYKRIYITEIRKVKFTCFKSIKHTGG